MTEKDAHFLQQYLKIVEDLPGNHKIIEIVLNLNLISVPKIIQMNVQFSSQIIAVMITTVSKASTLYKIYSQLASTKILGAMSRKLQRKFIDSNLKTRKLLMI